LRVNVGSFEFAEADGTVWVTDIYRGGEGIGDYTVANTVEIAGTENDALYRSEVYGDFTVSVPVATPGQYLIVMHFAELFHPAVGSRIFDIKLEGETVLSNLDVVKVAGAPLTAIQYTFIQSITDGAVDIEGVTIVDNAKLSGVEIFLLSSESTSSPTASSSPSPTTAAPVTASPTHSSSPSPTTAAPTGSLSPSPTTASPTGSLSPSPTTAAPMTAVPTGSLSPSPTTVAPSSSSSPSPTTAAPTSSSSPSPTTAVPTEFFSPSPTYDKEVILRVNVGSFEFTHDGTIWVTDTYRGGEGIGDYTVANTVEVAGTENDALYRSEVYGDFTFSVPVEVPGKYLIVMHFAELYHPAAGSRIFDIKLEGATVLSNLDVVEKAGAPFTAIQYTFIQSITDGAVDIEGVTIVDNAQLNGVEIFLLPGTE